MTPSELTRAGIRALNRGEPGKAFDIFEKVCEMDSSDPRAFHRAGSAALRLRRTDIAAARLRRAADLYFRRGMLREAAAVFRALDRLLTGMVPTEDDLEPPRDPGKRAA